MFFVGNWCKLFTTIIILRHIPAEKRGKKWTRERKLDDSKSDEIKLFLFIEMGLHHHWNGTAFHSQLAREKKRESSLFQFMCVFMFSHFFELQFKVIKSLSYNHFLLSTDFNQFFERYEELSIFVWSISFCSGPFFVTIYVCVCVLKCQVVSPLQCRHFDNFRSL